MPSKLFSGYLHGVGLLLEKLGRDHPSHGDLIGLQTQLKESIDAVENVVEALDAGAKRTRLIVQLDKICGDELGIPFEELCSSESPVKSETFNTQEIHQDLEQMRDNNKFSNREVAALHEVIEMTEEKVKGDVRVSSISELSSDVTGNSSLILAYFLTALANYHAKWERMIAADEVAKDSVVLFGDIKQYISTLDATIQQTKGNTIAREYQASAQKILVTMRALHVQFASITSYLYSGEIPYHANEKIKELFDDLKYFVGKYTLMLGELYPPTVHSEKNLSQ